MAKEEEHKIHPVIENLRKIINDRGITQAAMAEYIGIAPGHFSRVLSGEVSLSLWQITNLAPKLGMDVIDLFTYPKKYVPADSQDSDITAMITLQLNKEKKEKVLRAVFGDKNLKLLNLK